MGIAGSRTGSDADTPETPGIPTLPETTLPARQTSTQRPRRPGILARLRKICAALLGRPPSKPVEPQHLSNFEIARALSDYDTLEKQHALLQAAISDIPA